MMSSYTAQHHGNRNPHQNPIKSHKGGYLRCPFNINASYAEIAEKRVKEDLACGGVGTRGAIAVADKDGMLISSSSLVGRVMNDDGLEGNDGRPWSRAGVGANKLSSKEKRTQQEQAELIYGRNSLANADNEDATTSGASASLGHAPSQENMFAVDTRDQATLQQVVPRAVREKVKRRKFEEPKEGRMQLGQRTSHHRLGKTSEGEEAGSDRRRGCNTNTDGRDDEGDALTKAAATAHSVQSAPEVETPAFQQEPQVVRVIQQYKSPRQLPVTPPPSNVQRMPAKPKNRMQMLDDLRSSALMGKRRKR